MAKVGNKTINYSVYVRNDGKPKKIDNTTSVQLPSIEMLTDTMKGSGILGEVDWPSMGQIASMNLAISVRVTGEDFPIIAGADDIELRWVTDEFDTNNIKVGIVSHKAFIRCIPKKMDEGKLEPGAATDGSFEYEVFAYKRIVNGKEIMNIDKFNGVFTIGGKSLSADLNSYL